MRNLILVTLLCMSAAAFSASADVTIGGSGREVEADTTQRIATLIVHSGSILNKSTDSVWVNFDAATVSTVSGGTSIEIKTGTSLKIPDQCGAFTFKTASGTSFLVYVGR